MLCLMQKNSDKLKNKNEKNTQIYVVQQCAYIHGNNDSNFHCVEIGLHRSLFIISLDMANL